MKVWLIESGDYSNHYVAGVFSSKEKALEAKTLRDNSDDRAPMEWEVDELLGWETGPVFHASIRAETGEINAYSEDRVFRHPTRCEINEFISHGGWCNVKSPISEDHARKVAIEKRQEWLRMREELLKAREANLI